MEEENWSILRHFEFLVLLERKEEGPSVYAYPFHCLRAGRWIREGFQAHKVMCSTYDVEWLRTSVF